MSRAGERGERAGTSGPSGSAGDAARIALFVLLVSVPRSSAAERAGRVVVDDLGQRVKLSGKVEKIVSLVPTNSELVCLLDCERLKAGTRYDRHPEELVRRVREGKIEIVGGGYDPNLERIVEIGPDLVLANGASQQKAVQPLKRMGFPVLSLYPQDLEGLRRSFWLLAEILGKRATAAEKLAAMEKQLEAIRARTEGKRKKRVYLQTWSNPMITVGRGSFAHTVIALAGGVNVFGDLPFDSAKVSAESVIERDPEVLVFVGRQEEFAARILERPEWNLTAAVRRRHLCSIDAAALRRTVSFAEGVETVRRCLFRSGS
jgi:ABC-type Fe3+-hydroxamate transport system substrate-binding protein